jgi:hypothetical protein
MGWSNTRFIEAAHERLPGLENGEEAAVWGTGAAGVERPPQRARGARLAML